MFAYFPGNYVWNLSVNIALGMGGQIGEIDQMCRPLLDAAARGEDAGTEEFFASWCAMADRLVAHAEQDVDAGHLRTAAQKYARASVYYLTAERMCGRGFAPRAHAYRKGLDSFRNGVTRSCEFVEIPYADGAYPALFVAAEGRNGPAPVMVFCNGLDSMKEMGFRSGIGPGVRPSRYRHPVHRPAGNRRGIAAVGPHRCVRQRALGIGGGGLSSGARRCPPLPDRDDGLVARRLLRAARGRLREAVRAVRLLGRQLQLG